MPKAAEDTTLLTQLADIERRLRNLESAPQLTQSSIQDGSVRVLDASSVERFKMGKLDTGVYGVRGKDTAGAVIFEVNSTGLSRPLIQIPTSNVFSTYVDVTAGATTRVWTGATGAISHDALALVLYTNCAVGTTGSVTLRLEIHPDNTYGTAATTDITSAAFALTSANNGYHYLKWAHGGPINAGSTDIKGVRISVMAYRTGGAGTVGIWQPEQLFFAGSTDLVTSGSGSGAGTWA